jgi:hypothetical protein
MISLKSIFTAGLGFSLANLVQGQIFKLDCAVLLSERGDPIKSPGLPNPDSHTHAIVGGTGFNLSMSLELAPDSKDTTCNRPFDHSNYWQPHLYYQSANNSFEAMEFLGAVRKFFVP